MPLPATIRCFYGGNSSPSRDFDQSIYGRTLIENGSVSTPASPTPPEGNQWLSFNSDTAANNFWLMPIASIPSAFTGCIVWITRYVAPSVRDDYFVRRNAANTRRLEARFTPTNIEINWTGSASLTLRTITVAHGMVVGNQYVWRIESTGGVTTLKKDNLVVGSFASDINVGSITSAISGIGLGAPSGGGDTQCASYIDAFMISDNPNEPLPSSGIPWNSISRVRRR